MSDVSAGGCPFGSAVRIGRKGHWEISDPELVARLLRDPRVVASSSPVDTDAPAAQQNLDGFISTWPVFSEQPEHLLIKRELRAWFSTRAADDLRPEFRAAALISASSLETGSNLVSYARDAAIRTVSLMLGSPDESDFSRIIDWAQSLMDYVISAERNDETNSATAEMHEEFCVWFANCYLPQSDSPIPLGFRTLMDAGEITLSHAVSMFAQLTTGALEPLTSGLVSVLLESADSTQHRTKSEAVDLGLLHRAPFSYVPRGVEAPLTELSDRISAGDRVRLMIGEANYTSYVQRQQPTTENAIRNLAFGLGPHFCFGYAVATAHLEETYQVLADQQLLSRIDPHSLLWHQSPGGPRYEQLLLGPPKAQ
ncbi:hypothetical protein [Microbacterium foliorum]|uniref:hypothetical protein n=1 Tax=Microbacterium foliorum TaxID=104336 RepID=UPI0028D82C64|nr:hypothetical protein [Microbacterium foliorum]